jgi:hypothetical protein
MGDLCDRAVREELGIPLRVASKLAGVSRATLANYERAPQWIGRSKADPCAALYRLFRALLAAAPGRRPRG